MNIILSPEKCSQCTLRVKDVGGGKRLLQHCIELAASEKIPFILESTAVGYSFYLASGFKVVERSHIEYHGNSYEWPVMVWKLSTLG